MEYRLFGYRRKKKGMSFYEICSILCKEPFNKSFEEIRKMTPVQVGKILFRPEQESLHSSPRRVMR